MPCLVNAALLGFGKIVFLGALAPSRFNVSTPSFKVLPLGQQAVSLAVGRATCYSKHNNFRVQGSPRKWAERVRSAAPTLNLIRIMPA